MGRLERELAEEKKARKMAEEEARSAQIQVLPLSLSLFALYFRTPEPDINQIITTLADCIARPGDRVDENGLRFVGEKVERWRGQRLKRRLLLFVP
jgi:hypothetical protein